MDYHLYRKIVKSIMTLNMSVKYTKIFKQNYYKLYFII